MFKQAGIRPRVGLKLASVSLLVALCGAVLANEQEQYVPADTHFYFGTGKKVPLEHMLALVPKLPVPPDLAGNAKSRDAFERLSTIFDNPAEQLAAWGVDTDIQMSTYSVGLLPVLRLSLNNSEKFETAIAAFEGDYQVKAELLSDEKIISRFYSFDTLSAAAKKAEKEPDTAASDSDTPKPSSKVAGESAAQDTAGILVANDGTDLILSVLFDKTDQQSIDAVTGATLPKKSIAAAGTLKQLRKDWSYGDEVAGFIDMQQIAATLVGSESETSKALEAMLAQDASGRQGLATLRSEPCRSEVSALAESWPMMVTGARKFEVSDKEVIYDSHLAMVVKHELLRDTLKLLRGVVPASQSSAQPMLSVGLGLTVDKLAQAVGQFSQMLAGMNYQCSMLSGLNKMAQSDLSSASMGVVMFGGLARGVQGLAFNVFDVEVGGELSADALKTIDTAVAISAEDPVLLVQTLKMMPQLGVLAELPLDGTEMSLNELLPIPLPEQVQLNAAIKGKNIVLYSGEMGTDYANRLGGSDEEGFFETNLDTRLILQKVESVLKMIGRDSEQELRDVMRIMDAYPKATSITDWTLPTTV